MHLDLKEEFKIILKMHQNCVKAALQYKVQLAMVALAFLIVVNIAILCHVATGSGSGQLSKGKTILSGGRILYLVC